MIVRQDADMLERFLPMTTAGAEERFAVCFQSSDNSLKLLRGHGFTVLEAVWNNSYAEARNQLLDWVRSQSRLPWTVQLDADEVITDWDWVQQLATDCPHPAALFPRYNLTGELKPGSVFRWQDITYPDPQMRMVRLGAAVRYTLDVHEVLWNLEKDRQHYQTGEFGVGPPIYHYGACRPRRKLWLKHHNYGQMAKGLPLLTECPFSEEELAKLERPWPVFTSPHPYA